MELRWLTLVVLFLPGGAPKPAAAPPVTIRGRVLNDDGSPVAGATVRLTVGFLGRETTVTTDATGRYALERVPLMTRAEQERLAELLSAPLGTKTEELQPLVRKQALLRVRKVTPPATLRRCFGMPPYLDDVGDALRNGVLTHDITLPPPLPLKVVEKRWPNGRLKSRGTCFVEERDACSPARHGRHRTWYKDGQLEEDAAWAFGEPTGARRVYWPNGKLKLGERYDEAGHPAEAWCYHENGQLGMHGTLKWNPDSPSKGVWIKDPLDWGKDWDPSDHHGTWTLWDSSGKLVARGEWRDGKPWDGTCAVRVMAHHGNPLLLGSNYRVELLEFKDGKRVEGKQ